MRPSVVHRVAAVMLLLLLGAAGSGLPSHHHGIDQEGPIVVDVEHHGHGVLLVEQSERLTAQVLSVALPALMVEWGARPDATVQDASRRAFVHRPHGQPPPTAQPRAPPVLT